MMKPLNRSVIPPRILHNHQKRSIKKRNNKRAGLLRVFICGPHGVGKTTLVEGLANENPMFTKREEIARKYFLERGKTATDVDPNVYPDKFESFQKYLMDRQCDIEEKDDSLKGVVIYDRGPDALVYISKYHPEGNRIRMEMLEKKNVKRALMRYKSSLMFLVRPDKNFSTKDNVRMDSNFEELMDLFHNFKQTFERLNIPFKIISNPCLQRRISQVLNCVTKESND